MAASALTVTPPNPTPPTNMSFTGATPPNVPNYTKSTYGDPKNWSYVNPKDFPPPYFDDGTAGSLTAFAANTAALASGTGATSGGTEGTYPGAGSNTTVNNVGAVPASTSVAHEGAGTEIVFTQSYSAGTLNPNGALVTVGTGPVQTAATIAAGPNATHASSMSPVTMPTFASIAPTTAVSGLTGTQTITCTGTGFTPGCRIWVDGMQRDTVFTSATTIACTVPKKTSGGAWIVDVRIGGGSVLSPRVFTWT